MNDAAEGFPDSSSGRKPERMSLKLQIAHLLSLLRPGGRTPFCQCGHEQTAHRHYRSGSDCALCECGGYRGDKR